MHFKINQKTHSAMDCLHSQMRALEIKNVPVPPVCNLDKWKTDNSMCASYFSTALF